MSVGPFTTSFKSCEFCTPKDGQINNSGKIKVMQLKNSGHKDHIFG